MRRLFLILMIALLPLRGWVGEAMAGEMLAQRVDAVQAPAATAVQPMAAHDDCMGHAQATDAASPDGDADAAPAPHDACPTCASCQACSSAALGVTPVAAVALRFAPPRPEPFVARFDSAERAPGFKPPIS